MKLLIYVFDLQHGLASGMGEQAAWTSGLGPGTLTQWGAVQNHARLSIGLTTLVSRGGEESVVGHWSYRWGTWLQCQELGTRYVAFGTKDLVPGICFQPPTVTRH